MTVRKRRQAADAELVFSAQNNHTSRCGEPPRMRTTDNPRLYHGYFENCYGEQFVFTFDQAAKTGTILGGDLEWGNRKEFTLELLAEALRQTRHLAAMIVVEEQTGEPVLPIIDAALALGRLAGLTGKEEIIWLRACLEACYVFADHPSFKGSV